VSGRGIESRMAANRGPAGILSRGPAGEAKQTNTALDLLDAIARFVDERVDQRLHERGVTGGAEAFYSSTNPPPGSNARTFSRWCRSGRVQGAEKDGPGWRCSVQAWREARAGSPKPTPVHSPQDSNVFDLLQAAGLRPTRAK
jgi:hypothetical protein